jgi:hypothetical protein
VRDFSLMPAGLNQIVLGRGSDNTERAGHSIIWLLEFSGLDLAQGQLGPFQKRLSCLSC